MTLRDQEAESIRGFVYESRGFLTGHVLDFGCGAQPYRPVVEEAQGVYHPYDRARLPANVGGTDYGWTDDEPRLRHYDAVICTQVVQYVPNVPALLGDFHHLLKGDSVLGDPGGVLLVTGPTNWPVVEKEDLHRYTKLGARDIVAAAGFEVLRAVDRGDVTFEGERWTLGWGIAARAL